jgi:DNA-binding NarL/FixJ family response regulator
VLLSRKLNFKTAKTFVMQNLINSTQKIKIVIADLNDSFREGIKMILSDQKNMEVVAETKNGAQLLKLLQHIESDVILLDIQPSFKESMFTLMKIKETYPKIKVITISMYNNTSLIVKIMQKGANSYLTKGSGSEIIREAIRSVHEKDFYLTELINKALTIHFRESKEILPVDTISLSKDEITLLKRICEGKNIAEIAKTMNEEPNEIEKKCNNLSKKLGDLSVVGLILFAIKNKYYIPEEK